MGGKGKGDKRRGEDERGRKRTSEHSPTAKFATKPLWTAPKQNASSSSNGGGGTKSSTCKVPRSSTLELPNQK